MKNYPAYLTTYFIAKIKANILEKKPNFVTPNFCQDSELSQLNVNFLKLLELQLIHFNISSRIKIQTIPPSNLITGKNLNYHKNHSEFSLLMKYKILFQNVYYLRLLGIFSLLASLEKYLKLNLKSLYIKYSFRTIPEPEKKDNKILSHSKRSS